SEETARAFTDDGGLHTGDIGLVDDEGFVRITGHLSKRYKLTNGKYVDPTHLEQRLRQSAYIDNVMVHGEGRDYNVALVVVDLDALNQWASQRELLFDDTASLLASGRVNSHILAEIGELSGDFRHFERVRKVALVATGFGTENGMLTSTRKLKRHAILAEHGQRLAALYDS
ncbi:MAG: long-chain fatty acid--CoA ligase, partial [Deltaproteobacteria bacterium]|nr:long-chain fatty acid--CoA ligase [Deltaproteobacteria bacterium]